MELSEILTDAVKSIKYVMDAESVIGSPIVNEGGVVVIPVSKMTVGFMTAGAELEGKNMRSLRELPLGGIGGGASIKPMGFLVMNGEKVRFLRVEEGESDKWTGLVDSVMEHLSRS